MSNETKSGTPKLNEALLKAQGEMIHPKRTKTNPHFGSKYADLDECWDAWMKVGPKNGLTVSQGGGVGAPANHLRLVTTLAHVSGEEKTSTLDIPIMKHDPQAFMAAFTYVRRAGLCGITGMVADTDDDGNSAARPPTPRPARPPAQAAKPAQPKPDDVDREVAAIRKAMDDAISAPFIDALRLRYAALNPVMEPQEWKALGLDLAARKKALTS